MITESRQKETPYRSRGFLAGLPTFNYGLNRPIVMGVCPIVAKKGFEPLIALLDVNVP